MESERKSLLVLGGTYASYDVVKAAKEMGIHTIVADYYEHGVAKDIADESVLISTTDVTSLSSLIAKRKIGGVFCGPSEFNIRNMIRLAEVSGLPCYTSMALWNQCANKKRFTEYCRQYGIDTPDEYAIYPDMPEEELDSIEYPIILKPVDASSSVGITVCHDKQDVMPAYCKAMGASASGRVLAEKYIDNGGEIFGAKYFVQEGNAFPYLLIDTYIVDPEKKSSLISAFAFAPSKYQDRFLSDADAKVRAMIKGMGIQNGTVFFQALPYRGKIYFHEMGYRLSGGMIYKLTEPLMGINDMKMMIRNAMGGACVAENELKRIDLNCNGRCGAQLMVPLNPGMVGRIEGLTESMAQPNVTDFLQYYFPGDVIKKEYIGTLQQHFGRFTVIADNESEILECVSTLQEKLAVYDPNGRVLNTIRFNGDRISGKN